MYMLAPPASATVSSSVNSGKATLCSRKPEGGCLKTLWSKFLKCMGSPHKYRRGSLLHMVISQESEGSKNSEEGAEIVHPSLP